MAGLQQASLQRHIYKYILPPIRIVYVGLIKVAFLPHAAGEASLDASLFFLHTASWSGRNVISYMFQLLQSTNRDV